MSMWLMRCAVFDKVDRRRGCLVQVRAVAMSVLPSYLAGGSCDAAAEQRQHTSPSSHTTSRVLPYALASQAQKRVHVQSRPSPTCVGRKRGCAEQVVRCLVVNRKSIGITKSRRCSRTEPVRRQTRVSSRKTSWCEGRHDEERARSFVVQSVTAHFSNGVAVLHVSGP